MNTYKRLSENLNDYIEEIESRIDRIATEMALHPFSLRNRRLRKERRQLWANLSLIRSRYYVVLNETRIIQYHSNH